VDWTDAERGGHVLIDTSDSATRTALALQSQATRSELLRNMRSSGIDTIEVYAGEPYEKEFIRFFKMRERRLRM